MRGTAMGHGPGARCAHCDRPAPSFLAARGLTALLPLLARSSSLDKGVSEGKAVAAGRGGAGLCGRQATRQGGEDGTARSYPMAPVVAVRFSVLLSPTIHLRKSFNLYYYFFKKITNLPICNKSSFLLGGPERSRPDGTGYAHSSMHTESQLKPSPLSLPSPVFPAPPSPDDCA